ncbi:MAG: hypothetical protein ACUVS2_01520 [Candidatus Flexifilum sp.]|jgi:hypothetical protein
MGVLWEKQIGAGRIRADAIYRDMTIHQFAWEGNADPDRRFARSAWHEELPRRKIMITMQGLVGSPGEMTVRHADTDVSFNG